MNYFIILISLGLSMRGLLYYLVSVNPISSKFSKLSIIKTNDYLSYKRDNKMAFICYIVVGGIISAFLIIINFVSKDILLNNYILFLLGIFLIDFFINIIINIKIKITNWDELNNKKNKL